MSIATEVMPPWPISVCGMRSVTMPSLSISIQALISVPPAVVVHGSAPDEAGRGSAAGMPGMWKPSTMPPPAASAVRGRR